MSNGERPPDLSAKTLFDGIRGRPGRAISDLRRGASDPSREGTPELIGFLVRYPANADLLGQKRRSLLDFDFDPVEVLAAREEKLLRHSRSSTLFTAEAAGRPRREGHASTLVAM